MIPRNNSSGLTLLETLIALAVMAMLAAILSSGLNFGILSLNQSRRATDGVEQALARHALRSWLEHALPAPYLAGDSSSFEGTVHGVAFLADIAGSDPRLPMGIPVEVSFQASTSVFIANAPSGASAEVSIELVAAGTELTFSYWGRSQPDQQPHWQDSWPATSGLPDLVRITFGSSGLPPMVVRPGKAFLQTEMSLSSLVPPALPSRP